ncbi:MAG: hypothetical protein NTW47_09020 [Proteobacteria bacterium]|nr:hypothetical protein [Pseudomonadota bacterium]
MKQAELSLQSACRVNVGLPLASETSVRQFQACSRPADRHRADGTGRLRFDHRWLRQPYCDGGIATVHLFVALCKFAESRAGAIEQHLPTKRFAPALGPGALDTSGFVIVKRALNAVRKQRVVDHQNNPMILKLRPKPIPTRYSNPAGYPVKQNAGTLKSLCVRRSRLRGPVGF